MATQDLVVRIGGEGGEGVISCGEILSKAVARGGLNIHAFRTFPAEIRGGLAMFQLRANDRAARSLSQSVDVLCAINHCGYHAYVENIKDGGVLLYDPAVVQLDDRIGGRSRIELPLEALSKEIAGSNRVKNIVALGALLYCFGTPIEFGKDAIKDHFGKKGEDVIRLNFAAVEAGYRFGEQHLARVQRPFKRQPDRDHILVTGNEAVALGAIAAGVDFVPGYPITPATPIFEFLCRELPKFGGKAIQFEDEIATLAAGIGASYAGARVLTATSGPGLSLMSETLNLAAMTECPITIVNVMRGGPSTGLPTKTEQSDLKFAIYGTSGESPRCIMAPLDIYDCFWQTVRAVRIAEKYQLPVIVLTDQALAYTSQNIPRPDLAGAELGVRLAPPAGATRETFLRYAFTETGISPMPIPGVHDLPYMATGLEHTESGAPNYTPLNHEKMTEKRFQKLKTLGQAIVQQAEVEEDEPEGCEVGVIGWGSTYGAICEALEQIETESGIHVAHLHPRILSPLNEWRIRQFLGPLKKLIVPEENYTGQYAHFLKGKFGIKPIEIHKAHGVPFTAEELYVAIKEEL
ncbi:MAG TPA: 2-oxoacid:acceptor oxidoreductase subunit alpha [Candidatus Krumholzibacteria bacterium]|nr:2-oxoacid:acceptor oxidoreductase subunit alpha [Candidatus Krumholzibacteria bacterium]HPD70954.1 2-oxoacid:acceptor oxidoreductase subunit alpha [Candidatus Krumholzibacteria bacterium]HRY39346.1 2-oxoacid:acceptor oxidoreductase subunit alpha [Candidatus Krumholzibacteria bacterium]